jgi:peptidoglycan/LPS O-acetylase OafA/YrhL
VWVSSGGSRRRRRRNYTAAQGVFVLAMIAVVYLLVSGGVWVELGWTLLVVSLIAVAARVGHRAHQAQHAGGDSTPPRS